MKINNSFRNKYNAKSSRCWIGHYHQSIDEARYCDKLTLLKKGKHIKSIDYQKDYPLKVNDKHICNIRVDFVVTWKDGLVEVHEYKGFETEVWRLKHKLFLACYPKFPYVIKKRKDLI